MQDELAERGIEQELVMIEGEIFTRYHAALREHLEPYLAGETDLRSAAARLLDAVAPPE